MSFYSVLAKRAVTDLMFLAVVGIVAWFWLVEYEAFEMMIEFMEVHESWDLDEIFLAIVSLGILGFVYAIRRHREARDELRKRMAAEGNTEWLAQHDILTHLPNRRFLSEFTQQTDSAPKGAKPVSYVVYSIDLDGFKKANDLLGHAGGDELLQKMSTRLKSLISAELIVRLGGDEFLVVADRAKHPNVMKLAEDIRKVITKPTKIGGIHAQVGVSIGISLFPDDAESLHDVVRYADAAMYSAKGNGGNNVREFDGSMHALLFERATLESDFRLAVENNEIVPYYQPLVDLKTGNIWGFEALARWKRPGHGFVSPEEFIVLAEDIGLITKLSEQLLLRACRDAKCWPDDLKLSFNLSPLQLTDNIIGLRVVRVLAESGLRADRLEIEITESAIVQDIETATQVLRHLREAGVKIALDDFGTGYSSLSHLAKLQFDRIKIDRSFVNDFEADPKQYNIVKAMLDLGKGLDLLTTAEGIEGQSQLASLQKLGCECGQGYLFGKAIPANEISGLLQAQETNPPGKRNSA